MDVFFSPDGFISRKFPAPESHAEARMLFFFSLGLICASGKTKDSVTVKLFFLLRKGGLYKSCNEGKKSLSLMLVFVSDLLRKRKPHRAKRREKQVASCLPKKIVTNQNVEKKVVYFSFSIKLHTSCICFQLSRHN